MSVRVPLGPMDSEGVRFDRPPSQVRWTEITNFLIHEGRLVSRPGFEVDNRGGSLNLPAGLVPSPILAFSEISNPGNTATGRESYTPGVDNLVPNSDADLVAGWSGTFADIDEGAPDAVARMSTSTVGASINIGFTNPSVTYDVIQGVVFHVRARVDQAGNWAKLQFSQRISSANNLIHEQVVTMKDDEEDDAWEDFYFTVSRDLQGNIPLAQSDLTGLQLVMTLDSAEAFQWENRIATGNGAHQEWEDAQDAGVADFADCTGVLSYIVFDDSNLPTNRVIRTGTVNDRQSFTFPVNRTYASITALDVSAFCRKPNGKGASATIQLVYYNSGGTEFNVGTEQTIEPGEAANPIGVTTTVNPDTGVAWTTANITGGEFGIKFIRGDEVACQTFSITIYGTIAGGTTVQIDVINAQILGETSSNPGNDLVDQTRIFSSNRWHNRYDEDTGIPTITDITNSVPLSGTGPGWPVHQTVLYGQTFLVNGVSNTVFYPDGSTLVSALTANNSDGATALTGRTVASFGNRLFYGWVKDNTTVTPERISFSRWQDASTHNHRSAGDFDLLDTPGGVVALVPLDEQNMAALKETGCYVIRRTGNDIFPFIRDVIDFQVGIIGSLTAKRVQFAEGTAVLFLGQSPTYGVNVFMFDGTTVQPIGQQIARALRDDLNFGAALITAHAQVDPLTNTYWLFIPEKLGSFCEQAWVMNLTTKQWTRAEFPWTVFSSGIWHMPNQDLLGTGGGGGKVIGGQPKLMLGTSAQYLPVAANSNIGYDETAHTDSDVGTGSEDTADASAGGLRFNAFTATLTTGDLVKPGDVEAVSYRFGVLFKARDPVNRVLIDVSEDGGQNFSTSQENFFGPDDLNNVRAPTGGTYFVEWDMEPTHAAQVRYRFRFQFEDRTFDGTNNITIDSPKQPQRIQIDDMWVTIESGADSE